MNRVIMFSIIDTGMIENITFLLLLFGTATSLLIATGNENVARVMNRPNVGTIREYKPTPSTPIFLVIIIFKKKPRSFDRKPPVSSIIVPVMNLLFKYFFIIINFMFLFCLIDLNSNKMYNNF